MNVITLPLPQESAEVEAVKMVEYGSHEIWTLKPDWVEDDSGSSQVFREDEEMGGYYVTEHPGHGFVFHMYSSVYHHDAWEALGFFASLEDALAAAPGARKYLDALEVVGTISSSQILSPV